MSQESSFQSPLIVEVLPDGERMRLSQSCVIGGFTIPIGFCTDFASVPRPFWWIFSRWGKHARAAVLHDYLYCEQPVAKYRADRLFRKQMEADGVRLIGRWLMWAVVAGFGIWKRRSAFGLSRTLKQKKSLRKFFPGDDVHVVRITPEGSFIVAARIRSVQDEESFQGEHIGLRYTYTIEPDEEKILEGYFFPDGSVFGSFEEAREGLNRMTKEKRGKREAEYTFVDLRRE